MFKRLLGVVFLVLASTASAQFVIPPYGLYITQADVSSEFFWGRYFVPETPTTNSFLAYYGADSKPRMATLGAAFTWDGTTIDVGSLSITSVTGLQTALNAKFTTPTGITGQYVRGDGSLGTFPSLATVATTGSYNDLTNKPTIPTIPSRSFANGARALNSCFQISSTRDAMVSYAVDVTTTVSLGGSPEGSAYLRTYTNSGCSTGQVGIISGSSGQPTTLTVSVGQQIRGSVNLYGMVPAGLWARIETSNTGTGTAPAFAVRSDQQEVQF